MVQGLRGALRPSSHTPAGRKALPGRLLHAADAPRLRLHGGEVPRAVLQTAGGHAAGASACARGAEAGGDEGRGGGAHGT